MCLDIVSAKGIEIPNKLPPIDLNPRAHSEINLIPKHSFEATDVIGVNVANGFVRPRKWDQRRMFFAPAVC